MKININKIFIGMGILIAVLTGVIIYQGHKIANLGDNQAALNTALNGKFTTFTDKFGDQVAAVQAAVFTNSTAMKDAVAQLNKNGANIRSEVGNQTQSLTLLDQKVGGLLTGKTTISGYDTIKSKPGIANKDTTKIFPIYKIDTANKWYSLNATVYHDHYAITPLFSDSLELKSEYVKHGLFKAPVLTTFALEKNPYSKTTGFKSILIKKDPAPVWQYVKFIAIFAGGIFVGTKVF